MKLKPIKHNVIVWTIKRSIREMIQKEGILATHDNFFVYRAFQEPPIIGWPKHNKL